MNPLTLAAAVAAALSGPTGARIEAAHAQAEAAVTSARGAWDPVLTASTGESYSDSEGYLAGLQTTSRSTSSTTSAGIQQILPTGTTVAVTTDLERDDVISDSALSNGERDTWSGAAGVTVTQDLLAPWRSSDAAIAVRSSRQALDQASVTRERQRVDAIRTAAEAWWTWWGATGAQIVASSSLDHARALEDRTRAWRDAGQIAQLELDRVTADRLQAERDQLQAEARVHRSADALLVLVGQPLGGDVAPAGPGSAWPAADLDDVERIVVETRQRSPTLLADRESVAIAEADLSDARARALPTLALTGSAGFGSLAESAAEAVTELVGPNGFPRASAALDLAVPLGGRSARGGIEGARARLAIAQAQLAQDQPQVEADTRAAVADVLTAQRGLGLSGARLEVARSTEDGESARVDEGLRRLDQLLDATETREEAENDVRTAEIALGRAELTLAALRDRAEVADGR